ncbi:hypothetical protein BGZ92_001034 [Podila epicladia]|nr:hypothetical protein BGZ92_001034 [Podila epicladia]
MSSVTLVQAHQDAEYISSKQSPMYQYTQHSSSMASTYSSSGSHLTRTNTDTTEVLVSHPASIGSSRHASDDEDDAHFHLTRKDLNQPPSPCPFQLDQPPQQQGNGRKVVMPDLDITDLVQNFNTQQLDAKPITPEQPAAPVSPTSPHAKHGRHGFLLRRKDSKMSSSKKSKKSGTKTSHGIFHDLKRFLKTGASSSPNSPRLPPTPHGHHCNSFETDLHKKYGKMGKILGHGRV